MSFEPEAFDRSEAEGRHRDGDEFELAVAVGLRRGAAEAPSSVSQLLAEARTGIRRYEPAEARERAAEGALLVDLRSHDERERDGIIPGSIHVPRSVLEWRVDEGSGFANPHVAERELELILVCNEGYSSSFAAAALQELGFAQAADLSGGFQAWRAAGLPTMPAPARADGLPGMRGPDR